MPSCYHIKHYTPILNTSNGFLMSTQMLTHRVSHTHINIFKHTYTKQSSGDSALFSVPKSPVAALRDCQFSLRADLLLVSAALKPGLVSSQQQQQHILKELYTPTCLPLLFAHLNSLPPSSLSPK